MDRQERQEARIAREESHTNNEGAINQFFTMSLLFPISLALKWN
jgi:hypothetical protein